MQLVRLRERLEVNPALQLSPDEVDEMVWGLTGAEPLFRLRSFSRGQVVDFGLAITWSMTSHAIGDDARESRTSALQEIRAGLRSSAINITPDENVAATRQLMQSLRNQIGPQG